MKKKHPEKYINLSLFLGLSILGIVAVCMTVYGIDDLRTYARSSPSNVILAQAEPDEGDYGYEDYSGYLDPDDGSWINFGEESNTTSSNPEPTQTTQTPVQNEPSNTVTNDTPAGDQAVTPTYVAPEPVQPTYIIPTPVVLPKSTGSPRTFAPTDVVSTMQVVVLDEDTEKPLPAHVTVRAADGAILGEGDADASKGRARVRLLSKDVANIGTVEAVQGRMYKILPFRHAKVGSGQSVIGPTITLKLAKVDETYDPTITDSMIIPYGVSKNHTVTYQNISKKSGAEETVKRPLVSVGARCPIAADALKKEHTVWPIGGWDGSGKNEKLFSQMNVTTKVTLPSNAQAVRVFTAVDNRVQSILVNGSLVWTDSASRSSSYKHGCATYTDNVVTIPVSVFKRDGNDVLEFNVEDYGLESYFDFQVVARVPAPEVVIPPKETFLQYIYRSVSDAFKFK